jgi:hypothetical protein
MSPLVRKKSSKRAKAKLTELILGESHLSAVGKNFSKQEKRAAQDNKFFPKSDSFSVNKSKSQFKISRYVVKSALSRGGVSTAR